jgi:hypothetical protein
MSAKCIATKRLEESREISARKRLEESHAYVSRELDQEMATANSDGVAQGRRHVVR